MPSSIVVSCPDCWYLQDHDIAMEGEDVTCHACGHEYFTDESVYEEDGS